MKRLKPYTEDFRTAISFLNSSNQRIALFKNYYTAQGLRPRKFGLDMDVRWNSTYLMLKHLLPYKEVFHVFITSNYGSTLLTTQHWYVAEQIMIFLELFYNSTVILSGVYYPTAPLVLHHMLDMAEHLQNAERDANFRMIATPMKLKFLKYWEKIPLIYSYAFILDPRAKIKGFFNVLELLGKATGCIYSVYYGDVKDELYRLFAKYEQKFGAVRSQRVSVPSAHTCKTKQAWGRIFGGPGESPVGSPSSSSTPSAVSELKAYLDSDPVTCYEESFDILLWWRDHKLTYRILSIMARDIMSVPVSTVSSESCFSCTSRILEDRRRRLLPEHVEMLTCIKDWEQGARREQHTPEDLDLEEAFKNLFLDEQGEGSGSGGTAGGGLGG
ncbi:zinc finger BED domain-containing protein RICESLEEPER 2-like [Miscanthus floridulus]|uniref:zinc finger BED domain-containing protein RICESLEEPER 2-like n=1 Tax=Miscanthus floridulus TaxID=154761 RepID=UPI0034585D7C